MDNQTIEQISKLRKQIESLQIASDSLTHPTDYEPLIEIEWGLKEKLYKLEEQGKQVEQSNSALKIAMDFCLSEYPKDINITTLLEDFENLVTSDKILIWEPLERKDPEEVAELISNLTSDIENLIEAKDIEISKLKLEILKNQATLSVLQNELMNYKMETID